MDYIKKNSSVVFTVLIAILLIVGFIVSEKMTPVSPNNLVKVSFNNIDVVKYEELMKTGPNTVIYIGRPTCHYCEQLNPILEQITAEYNVVFNYLNTDEFKGNDRATFDNLSTYLDNNEKGATPILAVFNNGKFINKQVGYAPKDNVVKFLKDSNIIK